MRHFWKRLVATTTASGGPKWSNCTTGYDHRVGTDGFSDTLQRRQISAAEAAMPMLVSTNDPKLSRRIVDRSRMSGNFRYSLSINSPTDRDGHPARECSAEECSPGYFKVNWQAVHRDRIRLVAAEHDIAVHRGLSDGASTAELNRIAMSSSCR